MQMALVSYFFKISMALRAVHNRLVEEYGIPYWGSYVLFAFATILLGALLGLLIVFMIDMFFPAAPLPSERDVKPSSRSEEGSLQHSEETEGDSGLRKRKTGEDKTEDDEERSANDNDSKKQS